MFVSDFHINTSPLTNRHTCVNGERERALCIHCLSRKEGSLEMSWPAGCEAECYTLACPCGIQGWNTIMVQLDGHHGKHHWIEQQQCLLRLLFCSLCLTKHFSKTRQEWDRLHHVGCQFCSWISHGTLSSISSSQCIFLKRKCLLGHQSMSDAESLKLTYLQWLWNHLAANDF